MKLSRLIKELLAIAEEFDEEPDVKVVVNRLMAEPVRCEIDETELTYTDDEIVIQVWE